MGKCGPGRRERHVADHVLAWEERLTSLVDQLDPDARWAGGNALEVRRRVEACSGHQPVIRKAIELPRQSAQVGQHTREDAASVLGHVNTREYAHVGALGQLEFRLRKA